MYSNKYLCFISTEYESLVSTNEAYFHMPKRSKNSNRMTTYTVKTDKLKKLQSFYDKKLRNLISDEYCELISDLVDTGYFGIKIVTLYVIPKEQYLSSDTTNYIKNYEDCISSRMKLINKNLDDKNNLEYRAIKCSSNINDKWRILTLIYPIERDIHFRIKNKKMFCSNCLDTFFNGYINNNSVFCNLCNSPSGLKINESKIIYGISDSLNENFCRVCGHSVNNGICSNCKVCIEDYEDLILNFNEERFLNAYEEN